MQIISPLFNLNRNSSANNSNRTDKSIGGKSGQYLLGGIWIASAVISLVVFISWIVITLVWPISDSERLSQIISLGSTRVIEINYPKHLLANSEGTPVYLTIDQGEAFTVSVGLNNSGVAIFTTGVPTTTVKFKEGLNGYIDITWPETQSSVPGLVISPDRISGSFHAIGQPRTVALFIRDRLSDIMVS